MMHIQHMDRQEIEDALEEIFGLERWESIRNLVHVNRVIKSSVSIYEAAERINELFQTDPKDLIA